MTDNAESADQVRLTQSQAPVEEFGNPVPVSGVATFARDEEYYIDVIVFLVENTLFRVPRDGFEGRPGTPFATMVNLARFNTLQEGSDDEHPVHLEGVEKEDFRSLLKVMYPNLKYPSTSPLRREQWFGVLKLSTIWEFTDLRKRAIQSLSKGIIPQTKIDIGKTYNVSRWILEGYVHLLSDKRPLGAWEEFNVLDMQTKLKLLEIRDRYQPVDRIFESEEEFSFDVGSDHKKVHQIVGGLGLSPSCGRCTKETNDHSLKRLPRKRNMTVGEVEKLRVVVEDCEDGHEFLSFDESGVGSRRTSRDLERAVKTAFADDLVNLEE